MRTNTDGQLAMATELMSRGTPSTTAASTAMLSRRALRNCSRSAIVAVVRPRGMVQANQRCMTHAIPWRIAHFPCADGYAPSLLSPGVASEDERIGDTIPHLLYRQGRGCA